MATAEDFIAFNNVSKTVRVTLLAIIFCLYTMCGCVANPESISIVEPPLTEVADGSNEQEMINRLLSGSPSIFFSRLMSASRPASFSSSYYYFMDTLGGGSAGTYHSQYIHSYAGGVIACYSPPGVPIEPGLIVDALQSCLAPYLRIHWLEAQPAPETVASDGSILYFFMIPQWQHIHDYLPIPEFHQRTRFACLVANLEQIPTLRGFQILLEDPAYGLFSMTKPYIFSDENDLGFLLRGNSQLTGTTSGEAISLEIYIPAAPSHSELKQIPVDVVSKGESLEELALCCMLDELPEFSFLIFDQVLVHDGIAYVSFLAPSHALESVTPTQGVAFYEAVYANLRPFEHITHVQLVFNNRPGGMQVDNPVPHYIR